MTYEDFRIMAFSVYHGYTIEEVKRDKRLLECVELMKDLSIEWCHGGTSFSYDGSEHTVSPESEPEFDVLDNLIEMINPDISFLKYKKIVRECVDVSTFNSAGFYGGTATSSSKTLNLRQLYEALECSNI